MARFCRFSLFSLAAVLLLADRVHPQTLPKRERARQDHQIDLSAREAAEAAQQSSLGAIWAGEGFELEAGQAGGLGGIIGWTGVDAEDEEEVAAAGPTSIRLERRINLKRATTTSKKTTSTSKKSTTTTKKSTATPRTTTTSKKATTTAKTTTTSKKTSSTTKKTSTTTKKVTTSTTKKSSTSIKATTTSKSTTKSTVKSTTAVAKTSSTAIKISTPRTTPATSKSSTTTKASLSTTTARTTTTLVPAVTTTSSKPIVSSSSPSTSSGTCAPTYVVSQMITGTGTLPKPTSFVKRATAGQGLALDETAFRVVGANIYWICNNEDTLPKGQYTDKGRVREALAIAVAMGGNTIRLTSCGTSVGSAYSTETVLGVFATGSHWDIYDYVIYAAGQYGLRVILPLTDDYDYYHGGKYTFLRWLGLNTGNWGTLFYSNAQAIAAYKQYIFVYLTHQNTYNGLTYAQDPTIMMWETGNELGAYIGKEGYPPAAWTNSIASYIKSIAPNQLIMDGSDGFYNYSTKATAPGLNVSAIDVMTDHGYPRNVALLNAQIPLATAAKKGLILGEYDWTTTNGGDSLTSYLAAIEATSYIGSLIWDIRGHDDQCCAFVQHNDGYSLYYPNGNTAADRLNIFAVVQHNYRMTGRAVPSILPGVTCPQPAF